jgi:glutamyl-tRNA synthetase
MADSTKPPKSKFNVAPVGRLAPSPTGAQHVGNARTYLIAWLQVRSHGGQVVLRIEDIDSPRVKPLAAKQALEDLQWLGLDWDGEPTTQTHRLHHYEEALQMLQAKELVYPCTCTRTDIERSASAPHADHEGPNYPGTCASRTVADAAQFSDKQVAWRFRTPNREVPFTDKVHGNISINPATHGGDFVVWKSAGTPAYQLAVVVDDAAQGVTEVIRGDDLIPSTPRQLLLYEALDLEPPHFGHVPLVVGQDGRRLAKRHGDTRLSALRDSGVKAEALIGLLSWSCGWIDRIEPVSAQEILPHYDLSNLPGRPWVLTQELLLQIGYHP